MLDKHSPCLIRWVVIAPALSHALPARRAPSRGPAYHRSSAGGTPHGSRRGWTRAFSISRPCASGILGPATSSRLRRSAALPYERRAGLGPRRSGRGGAILDPGE